MAIARTATSPTFSGVALADILANGVAIIVIMIVVTLMTRNEQEQEKLEQSEDISVLLSREIASSFVMNSLPTSSPAVLHDYVNSPLDRNPNEARMPIIELRQDFIRNYYTGEIYTRDELLRYQNSFDTYIRNLSKEQLRALRIDVYSIAQFYLTMSILKAHNHSPRHWHFLNRPEEAGGGVGDGIFKNQQKYKDETWRQNLRPGSTKPDGAARALPEDIELTNAYGSSAKYNQRLPFGKGRSGKTWRESIGLPPVNRDDGLKLGGKPWEMFNRLSRDRKSQRKTKLFRAAIEVEDSVFQLPMTDRNLDLNKLVRSYLEYMSEVQGAVNQGLPGLEAPFNFRWDIFARMERLSASPPSKNRTLIDNLAYWLSQPILDEEKAVRVAIRPDSELPGQHVVLPVNDPIQQVQWLRDANQPTLAEGLPEFMHMHVRLSLYPDIYLGLDLPITLDTIVMMPPDEQISGDTYRWRIVTLVNPEVNDIVTGFIYAAITEEGALLMPVDKNAVAFDYFRLTASFKQRLFLGESWQIIFYTLFVAIFALAAVHRYRRRV